MYHIHVLLHVLLYVESTQRKKPEKQLCCLLKYNIKLYNYNKKKQINMRPKGHMPHLSSNSRLRFDSEPRGELALRYELQVLSDSV